MNGTKITTLGYENSYKNRIALGTYLRVLRLSKNLRLVDVEYQTGIPNSSISSYETGIKMPNTERVTMLAGYYEVTPNNLMKACFKDRVIPKEPREAQAAIDNTTTKCKQISINNDSEEDKKDGQTEDLVASQIAGYLLELNATVVAIRKELHAIKESNQELVDTIKANKG